MLGSPAGPGGPSQRGGLWPIAPAVAPTSTSFTGDGLSKYGIYSLFPGGPNFGSALYSHRFTSGSLQSSPTTFHATHKDAVFSTGYTFGAPTPPPGSPYSPVPVTQLELLTKGFNSNIIIQQPEYPLSPKKLAFAENKQPQQRCEEKCCSIKAPQKPCICSNSPSSTTNAVKTKFIDNISGCSRTNPIDWSPVSVKKEPGTPCQVAEITTSVSPVVKIEVTSPIAQKNTMHDIHTGTVAPVVTTNGNIPVGIAVARQRIQQHEIVSSPSLPPTGLLTTVNTSTQIKEMSRISEIDSTPGMAANTTGGVPTNGGTLMQCTDDRSTGLAGWPVGGTHSSALTAPTLWQYPASLPMEPVVPMSVPIPPVGFQLVRDPNIGGLLLLPSAEPLHQAVVWPSYSQPPSHVLLPQIPPPPLQLLSSASSDYLSSSTTLHQHTQTHSTRLVAVTTDTKRKIPLPIPATTLIKIETDATSLDQTKTLQAVSTIASNTATVFTDQNVAPLVTTHVIYQHPTNLILSQTPAPETACRSQATSPVTCLTPPPENIPQNEEETLGVQDASNQTESPICSEDDVTAHALTDETRSKHEEDSKDNLEEELPNKVPEIEESAEATPKPLGITQESQETEISNIQLTNELSQEECRENEKQQVKPDSTEEKLPTEINMKPDLSGLELLSSIVEFENCRESIEKVNIKQEMQEIKMEVEQNEEVLKGIAHMTLKDGDAVHLSKKIEETFGGLDLLCEVAEQRILEEVTENHKLEVINIDKDERNKHERKKEKRKSKKHSDEPKHKKSKYSLEEKSHNVKHSDIKDIHEHYDDGLNEFTKKIDSVKHYTNDVNKNQCFCRTEESYRTYKTRESEEEVKKFIASKSQPLCCKGDWPCMNPNELVMRKKLADLQRKYREKQKELNRLKIKKHADHKDYKDFSKKSRSRKKSTHSDKDRETPPPLLDKMDVPLKPNKSSQELLKPPTLCAYGNENIKLFSSVNPELDINNKGEYVENSPIKRSYTPSIDLSDSTPEKISSSKKRKVGRPKKLLTSSGLRTGTETIVAKKPRKGNIVGYLLAAKEKLIQSKNGQLYSNSPPRFIEEVKEVSKHKQHKNKNDESCSKKKRDRKHEKPKIRPKLKAEPMVKKFAEEEDHEWCKEIINKDVESTQSGELQQNEELETENKENVEDEINLKDQRCTLTSDHLETDKLRVLTAMGGLFYAGHLNAVQPPDVYSITLDGERGNRPHIMSREEILRDAIVEVAPTTTEELLVGTRICAYWSQQYRCLYPGSVAEPGTPDPALDSKFVCVEFDDGDSGRIALDDIRLLPPDYPIIEYDPNPLLSLSKRRRRTSMAEDKQRVNQAASMKSTELPQSTPEIVKNQDMNKADEEMSKVESDSHRERKRLKKRKREKFKQKLQHETKKKKRKHKCNDENCKHKKHHKKHRKHRKHHHKTEEESKLEITETPEGDDNENRETEDEQQDSFEENSEDFAEYEDVGNPEDEVTVDDILEDKKKKSKKIRDRQESCESRSKMSAFLPARQLWGWSGKGYWRSRFKGRIKKQFYKAIQRGKETILVGDSAVFLSTGRPDRPYIGKIEAMWEACGTMVVKVKWFYHPEETIGCPLNLQYPGALFESPHVDENDVQTISHKCEVLPLEEYTEKLGDDPQRYATIYDNNDIYYLAGYYDPTTTTLKIQPNIPFLNAD